MNSTRYCFFAAGSAEFFRAVADAESQHLRGFFIEHNWQLSRELVSGPTLQGRTLNLDVGVLGVVGIFIGTCFAKKIFDEVYNRTLKRPIASFLDSIFRVQPQEKSAPIQFQDIIVLQDIEVVVVIEAIVERDTVACTAAALPQAWTVAHDYIDRHGAKAPVHLHKIEGGKVSQQPELFDALSQTTTPKRKPS